METNFTPRRIEILPVHLMKLKIIRHYSWMLPTSAYLGIEIFRTARERIVFHLTPIEAAYIHATYDWIKLHRQHGREQDNLSQLLRESFYKRYLNPSPISQL